MQAIRRQDLPSVDGSNFDEGAYLAANADVAAAVAAGEFATGRHHFDLYGRHEGRPIRAGSFEPGVDEARAKKMEKLQPFLRVDLPHLRRGLKFDFLTEALRAETRIVDTHLIAGDPYLPVVTEMIDRLPDGLILDCGAGRRPIYYSNVVNYEIVDYDSTDVIGVGEHLPFTDNAFDGVISVAVLEHVRNPFRCASEICRVLKPGGKLICGVPFLAPLHGYPHHYYNMTGQGLRALFEDQLEIENHTVPEVNLPIHWLSWTLNCWAAGLTDAAREEFLSLRVSDLLVQWQHHRSRSWVMELSNEKNFEIALGTMIFARKR
jgi:SAM-dependent methyltransferase